MEHYTVQQHIEMIRIYHQNSLSVRATLRALREIYGQHHCPAEGTIRRIVGKFETTSSVVDQPKSVCCRNTRSDENIAIVQESVSAGLKLSTPSRAQEPGLSQISTWQILRRHLSLFPYKIQLTEELNPNDYFQRRQFADWALEQLKIHPDFGKKNHF